MKKTLIIGALCISLASLTACDGNNNAKKHLLNQNKKKRNESNSRFNYL
ncbi:MULTISPECIES: hypothetical protein [Bacillus cereus group]|uniref:Lipoprotein n=1 Tax=Bacillus proteolyticus TaxID=2026192 RepID=A0ABV3IL05_9BACI|nr:hypothetical protein [Bacillus cereus group sp. N8]